MSLYDPINDGIVTKSDVVILEKSTELLREKNKSNSKFNLLEINDKNVAKNIASDQIIFSILIDSDVPYSIFNLVVKYDMEYNEIEQSVVRYKMNHNFGTDYYQHLVGFEQFEGSIQFFDPVSIFNTNKSSSRCLENMNTCTINGNGSNDPNTGSGVGSTGSNGEPNYGGAIEVSDCIFIEACINCRPGCAGACHPQYCECSPKSRYVWYLECHTPLTDNDNTNLNKNPNRCPDENDVIPIINTPVIGDEDSGPTDFTEELQAGLNSDNFLDDFLGGNTSIDQSTIIDAAECADCKLYPAGSTFAPINNYNQCVLTQILSDAPCAGALSEMMDEHGLELTPAQQINLVGPGGIRSGCGENGTFIDEAFEILCDSGELCINDIAYIDVAPGDPVATSENPPCPELFNFVDPSSDSNNSISEAIITNITIQIEGLEQGIHFPNMLFQTTESPNCGVSSPIRAANAIASAIEEMDRMSINNEPFFNGDPRMQLWILINRYFRQLTVAACGAESGSVVAQVLLPNDQSILNEHTDVDIVDFEEKFSECD